MTDIKNIIILGGGTAGLISALILNRTYPNINITVIESKNIGIIGVGEGTTNQWNHFVRYCNINIAELIKETDATYKVGIKFANWNGDGKSYIHSLVTDLAQSFDIVGYPYCLASLVADSKPNEAMLPGFILENRIPITFDAVTGDYVYHFNTFKLNDYLHKICKERNIKFVETELVSATVNDAGIDTVLDCQGITYSADFYIDSSGFKRFLSSQLGSTWVDYSKYLPMNHAIAFPTDTTEDLPMYTVSTALSSGWNWRIPTYSRYGNGYVFNDAYITADQAKEEIEQHYGHTIEVAKDIKFKAGRVDKFWIKNCVSLGLSGAFVEPLEATSIGFTILQCFSLIGKLPYWEKNPKFAEDAFNNVFTESFDNIVDFIQLHYFTRRTDSPFWKEMEFTVTDFNKETLALFKERLPTRELFEYNPNRMFGHQHWLQVMNGLGMFNRDSIADELSKFVHAERFARDFISNSKLEQQRIPSISHREFLNRYHR